MSVVSPSTAAVWRSWRGCVVVTVVTGLVWWLCFHSPMFWVTAGMGEPHRPFIDLYGLLVACDAVKLGLNPFLPSPLDPYHRPHVYTEWWLVMGSWGLGRKDVLWLGAALAGGLILTAVAMARPRTWRESAAVLALLLSPAFLLAANRTNNDLVILILVSGALVCFRQVRGSWRMLGVMLFAVSAVLKYYPLVTIVLLLDLRKRRDFLAGFALYVFVLVLAWPGLEPGLRSAARFSPQPVWLYAFGAPVLMRDFELNLPILWLAPAGLLAIWALVAAWRQRGSRETQPGDALHQRERDFVCGAAMLVGLFFLGASFVYKLIFAIWLLPWLWESSLPVGEARWRRAIWYLLLAVTWFEGSMAIGFNVVARWRGEPVNVELLKYALVLQQLITWGLVAILTRFLAIYLCRWSRLLLALQPARAA